MCTMSFHRLENAKQFSNLFGTFMIIFYLSFTVIWLYFFHINARMANVDMNVSAAIHISSIYLLNSYGWFCIKKMKWRKGMLIFAVTGSLWIIMPILKAILEDPVAAWRSLRLAGEHAWSTIFIPIFYWDIILLSMVRWYYNRPQRK